MSISTLPLQERDAQELSAQERGAQDRGAQDRLLSLSADYLELTKPKIAALELVTVAVAASIAAGGSPNLLILLHTLAGTALVAASASALNQWLERDVDALMSRTADRPLPAGRLGSSEVLFFGGATAVAGIVWLAAAVNLTTAVLGFLTWGLYVWIYTPLKTRTSLNTVVGALAGAMPVLMGWSAVGELDLLAATLFVLVYLWQFPHFMAIAWIYRREYAKGGFKMLTVVDPSGRRAGRLAFVSALALLPISLLPIGMYPVGSIYLVLAVLLGCLQVMLATRFLLRLDEPSARSLLRCSLVYLPAIMLLLMLGPL